MAEELGNLQEDVADGLTETITEGKVQEDLRAEIRELIETGRRSQGASDRLSARLEVLAAEVQTMRGISTRPTQPDPLEDLDLTDPSIKALANIVKQQNATLQRLEATAVQANMSQQERAWRDYLTQQVADTAELVGVDFATIQPSLQQVPTNEILSTANALIRQAVKGRKKAEPVDEAALRRQGAEAVLRKQGNWSEEARPGGSGAGSGRVTAADIANMSPEEYSKQRKEIHAQYLGKT